MEGMPTNWRVGASFRFGIACVALILTLSAPAIAAEDPAWPEIRADYRAGRYGAALQRLERLVRKTPSQREAYYYMALVYWRLERYDASARAWQRVLDLDPKGPFGKDAVLWLATLEDLTASPAPPASPALALGPARPVASPSTALPSPTASASPVPSPAPAARVTLKAPRQASHAPAPWLQAQPNFRGNRARSRNAKPGYFKALDGTFEFIPPAGFVLLDEGEAGGERRALFGPGREGRNPRHSEQPPTLLMAWREVPALRRYRPDQRVARARQMLMLEASTYGPGAKLESRFGVQTVRIAQRQGNWSADTWLFFQAERLYAFTYGGETARLGAYAGAVNKSLSTLVFYP